MKKFERLSPEQRRQEIREAAMQLFLQKGFSATTMENIVQQVSLSKGGVYRLYPSTTAILRDLMLSGMRLRNEFYEQRAREQAGKPLTLDFLIGLIGESLLLYPEFSGVYAEFLWEKRRNPELESCYQSICAVSIAETKALITRCGAEDLLLGDPNMLRDLTELMNAVTLSLYALDLHKLVEDDPEFIRKTITGIMVSRNSYHKGE